MAIVYFMKEAAVNHMDEGDSCEDTHHGFVPNFHAVYTVYTGSILTKMEPNQKFDCKLYVMKEKN